MKKYFLVFLIAFICFFSIDKVYAMVATTGLPQGNITWTNSTTQYIGDIGQPFNGFGEGYLYFSINVDTKQSSTLRATLKGASVSASDGTVYACDLGTVNAGSTGGASNITYSAVCPVSFSGRYMRGIYLEKLNASAAANISFGGFATFISDNDYTSILESINPNISANSAQIQQLLSTIITNQQFATQNVSSNSAQIIEAIKSNLNSSLQDIADNQKETNKKLDEANKQAKETNDYLKDDTPPDTDISSLGTVSGLLPEGPVDSLLNIPFDFLSVLTSSFGGVCVPLEGNFVFNSKLSLPCFSEMFYGNVPSGLMVFINTIPSAFVLIMYFKHLYKKVDRAVSMDSNSDDEWGVL